MGSIETPVDIKVLLQWMAESQSAHSDWRRQSWEDYEFRDGKAWTRAAFNRLVSKGINPLTINRIFPILNLIHGNFIKNQQDIIAKGRTKSDSELGQVMSEAFAFVKDQNGGAEKTAAAFNDEITAGYGCIEVFKNPDPRNEVVGWRQQPWYSCWWDPYASPWLDKETCRYFFTASWKNLEDVIMLFPEKRKELLDKFSQLSRTHYVPDITDDQGTAIEEYHRLLSSNSWVNSGRKRIRPVEMWYTKITKSTFAVMPDSRVIDLDNTLGISSQYSIIKQAKELVTAHVKKMRVATFASDLLLQDVPSPYAHDKYPFAPFVGYLDRFNCPFGVPRQVKEQLMEVNKRRSMALALISNRRIIAEEGSAKDLNKAYDEANRVNGLVILNKGKKGTFEIEELANLAPAQIDLMLQSEREIQEIVGTNDEALGKESKLQSGVALERKMELAAPVTASLLENAKYSQKRLGELTLAMVQSEWTGPKVLRVVDRISGAEKFVEINQRIYNENLGIIETRNSIAESTFDIVVSSAPMTDTMREKNMELLFSAINKAPPEAVGPLLNVAFEISDIPSKDALLKQIRAATGIEEIDPELPKAEQEAILAQKEEAKNTAAKEEADFARREREMQINLGIAKMEKLRSEAAAAARTTERDDWEAGRKLGQELLQAQGGKLQ